MTDPTYTALLARVHENPFDEVALGVLADWLEEHGDPRYVEVRKGRVPVNDEDVVAAYNLKSCTFLPGSWEKRFARDMATATVLVNQCITPRQFIMLWLLCHRYRKQLQGLSGGLGVIGVVAKTAARHETYSRLLKENAK